ncbi:putative B3 domain-containing protein At4g03160 [Nicotiana sylvestris]|uniref:B3 domain-containing protein At4g03160 n=2 Tax=Nicotiana TaxID=4085 RepID=A0A1S4C712_TOBAC|nr:PREDICTED: putative B3 domain-containing protein At4g03160 [Nicotiana sylvestris]XP_016496734.1 PREDICTED: putative B3 domain-containing protein At4g03160 [Nicotiana tabacum]
MAKKGSIFKRSSSGTIRNNKSKEVMSNNEQIHEENRDDDKKVINNAAYILLSMKHHVLKEEDAILLQNMLSKRLPRIPPIQSLRGIIGICSEPFEKHLTHTDLSDNFNRLSLNRDKVIAFILPMLHEHEDVYDCKGIQVTTYGPDGVAYDMIFKSWADSKLYVLNSGWKKFYRSYGLHEHNDYWATVWMFRHRLTDKPCFALTWKHDPIRSSLPRSKNNNRK